jgi:hypothetical protein
MRRIVGDLVLVYDAAPVDVAIDSRVRGMEWNFLGIAQGVERRERAARDALGSNMVCHDRIRKAVQMEGSNGLGRKQIAFRKLIYKIGRDVCPPELVP